MEQQNKQLECGPLGAREQGSWVVFLQLRRVDELEKIQVERAANNRQMNLEQGEGSFFFFTVLLV